MVVNGRRGNDNSLKSEKFLPVSMRCTYCNCEISTLNPFAMCPNCGMALESAHTSY